MLRTTYLADGWQFAEAGWTEPGHRIGYSQTEWLDAVVPGSVHLDLIRHGIIADPHERMAEIGAQWVDDRDWTYRCTFDWRAKDGLPKRLLNFEGLDTVCRIRLNGEEIGACDNMFLPVEIDVTDRLLEGPNELLLEFSSAKRVGAERRAEYFAEQGLSDPVIRFGPRSFVRKMQCAFGWDWGPTLASCGVWQPVSLVEYAARIARFSTKNNWNPDGSITIEIDGEIDGDGQLEVGLWPTDGKSMSERDEAVKWENGRATFHDLRRWQPVGRLGDDLEPVRYQMSLSLLHDGEIHDEAVRTVGFSQNRLLREQDSFGESFEFEINGHRLWSRGANWIPEMSFPGAITRERLRERLEQAVDIGCNTLRVWGGGLYESEDFYDLCDELGLLVWQDFPFACGYYPDTGEWPEKIRVEAEYHVRRLRYRPCFALWCGNNENLQMFQQKWDGGAATNPPRYYGEHLYDGVLAETVATFDGMHTYIPTSPCGESLPDSNGGKIGDSHYWDVWHGRGDWKHYVDSDTRFSSEYGFASSCALATWETTLAEADWRPDSPAVRWHDKTGKGDATYKGYVELHYPKALTLEDWVYTSQLNQRDAMRFGVEHFRRFEHCRGSLIWQLNDIWPVQSWSLIDSAGRYKAAAYELRRLYSDRLISLVRKGETMEVHVRNDHATEWPGDLIVRAVDLHTGEVLREAWTSLGIPTDSGRKVLGFDLVGLNTAETIVYAHTSVSGDGDRLSPFEMRTWRLLVEPKEVRLSPPTPILASGWEEGTLCLRVEAPVVDLMLSIDGDTAPFRDNFLTIPTPGILRVGVDKPIVGFEARSLAGAHAVTLTRSPLA